MMRKYLPHPLIGILSLMFYALNTICLASTLVILSFFKFIIPIHSFIVVLDKVLIWIATLWISVNSFNCRLFCDIDWDIRGLETLEKKEWYLVLSNHQSWVDILTLQTVLNKRIPMLKFFLKKELIWIPILGLAWWALDFPFMKRYTRAQLEKKPHLKGKDLASTRKACEKFKHVPVSVINFVEGTRFTPAKKKAQNSEFEHLLKPKAGGVAFVLGSMGEYLHKIINVTIVYPEKTPTFWEYVSGQVNKVIIDFEVIDVDKTLTGDYFNNPEYKKFFFEWLNELWQKKDKKIQMLKSQGR